jgi:hypothetical protein
MVPVFDADTLPRVVESRHVQAGTGMPVKRSEQLANVVTYSFAPPLASAGAATSVTLPDDASVVAYRQEYPVDLDLYCLRDAAIAAHAGGQYLIFSRIIPTYIEPEGDLGFEAYDIGAGIRYTHPRGEGASGYVDRVFQVLGHTFLPGRRGVRLDCLDVELMQDEPT